MNTTVRSLVALLCLAAAAAPVAAQTGRAAIIAREQAEKAGRLRPYEPSRAERLLTSATRGLLETPTGVFPAFGSVYSGGGFALGAGYRQFYGDRTTWEARGLYSVRSYKLLELATNSPGHARGRVDLFARTTWRDAPLVAFYGIGPDSEHDDRTHFGLRETSIAAGARARTARWLVFEGALGYEDYATSTQPPLPATEPDAQYVHGTASAGFDWRPAAGYARRGGLYEVEYHNYRGRAATPGFDRVDVQLVQHIPIVRENWVLSLRGSMQTTLGDDPVPFFMLPSLGSGSTLRGYGSWRFRDRHSELMTAEWRWIPNRLGLDMALFYDAGKVASVRRDLDFDGLNSDVGIGVRFHGPGLTALRVELARGREGMRIVFSGGPAF